MQSARPSVSEGRNPWGHSGAWSASPSRLTCQVAKGLVERIGSAAVECSNHADLHLTLIDPN